MVREKDGGGVGKGVGGKDKKMGMGVLQKDNKRMLEERREASNYLANTILEISQFMIFIYLYIMLAQTGTGFGEFSTGVTSHT